MTVEQIKNQLRSKTTQEIETQLNLLVDLKSRGVKDEIMISLLENEMERRILAWEAAE